uniref:HECT-type E3 ubiquitin transferase n=1 Tax=Odontella aurita TaxID=265563 RepID=A0A7S4N172_9STRA
MREEREREERRDQETRDRATGNASSGDSRRGSAETGDEDGDAGGEGGPASAADGDAEPDDQGPNPAADDSSPQLTSQQPQMQQQQQQAPPPQPQAYMVTVPPGVRPGGHFPVMVAGQRLMVQCPHNARPGMNVRIVPPTAQQPGAQSSTNLDRPPDQGLAGSGAEGPPRPQLTTQMFEVIVPAGVRPNQPFALIAGGQRVLVTCPPNAYPGQKIRFQLPVSQPSAKSIESVKLNYENAQDGWIRTVRVTDMKFQWVRMDERGDVDTDVRFDMRHSAYVRKLVFLEGNDDRMRTGYLSLVPASEAAVDSRVVAGGGASSGREIVGYADLAAAQGRRYEDKARWFQDVCARLTNDWNEGHLRINVRRPYLLQDSMAAVMSLGRDDLRKIWRFEFMGEAGIDAGGLAREWFHLVTEQIFDPDNGLWMSSSESQQMYMRINPASEISCPEDHLVYFRFLGRVMGKALFDRQLVSGHMVRHMYKHLLGWPISFDDLELFDEEYYIQLKKLAEYDDISVMCLSFVVTEDALGIKREVDLIPGGEDVDVTNDNLPEYLEANLKYRMLDRIRPQLTELLLGFFDVIPEPLLTIFDYQELELLMCGLPTIDVDDWMANTNYTGSFEGTAANGPSASRLPEAAQWFWEAVRDEFDQETRARLLQFVTGTSGVPSRGFSVLQGNDGNIRKFTVHGVDPAHYPYPRAHTCFNRIDLPMYTTKEELLEKLRVAVSTSATGFDIE